MRKMHDDLDKRVPRSISLPLGLIVSLEQRAARERRTFSSYVLEALEALADNKGQEAGDDHQE